MNKNGRRLLLVSVLVLSELFDSEFDSHLALCADPGILPQRSRLSKA